MKNIEIRVCGDVGSGCLTLMHHISQLLKNSGFIDIKVHEDETDYSWQASLDGKVEQLKSEGCNIDIYRYQKMRDGEVKGPLGVC